MIDPTGTYEVGGMPLNITADGPGWSINMAGVPEGFEPGMVRINDSAFRIVRGPFDGGIVAFNQDGSASIGPLPMGRVDGSYVEQIGSGLIAPPHADDPERDEAFADVLSGTPHGGRIEWTLQYPKHEFVRWAMDLDQFIFHSSNNTTIAEFVPIRTSVELQDHGERGNLGAVYGTHDGFWSMFFGVVDRKTGAGIHSQRGEPLGSFRWPLSRHLSILDSPRVSPRASVYHRGDLLLTPGDIPQAAALPGRAHIGRVGQ